MSNALIDFYYTDPSREGFEKFFSRHAEWIFDDITRYHERTGDDWWKSKNVADFWVDHERVRRIVDDYFNKRILKSYFFDWLQNLEKKLQPRLTTEPIFDRRIEDIDLNTHKIVRVFYDSLHQIALEPLYKELFDELLKMLRAEKIGIKRCPSCERLFEPTPRGHAQIFCAEKCKKRYYRAKKKKNNLKNIPFFLDKGTG